MSKYSRRRQRLLERGNTCHWCGVELVYIHAERWPKRTMPSNFATIDHLRDRLSCPDRQDINRGQEEQTVLACLTCNQRRNREQQRALARQRKARHVIVVPAASPLPAEDADGPAPEDRREPVTIGARKPVTA